MYLWIGLGFSVEDENSVREYCKQINTEYRVNEQSFTLPQHISLKQSFMTDKYNEIINDLKLYFQNSNEIKINISSIGTIPGVIWLEISENPILRKYHNDILKILKENYQIDGIGFDGDSFKFHSTLFQDIDNKDTIENLFNSIDKQLFENKKIVVNKICFGLSELGKVGTFKLVDEIKLGSINVIEYAKNIIIERSNKFQEETRGTKDEYNLWLEHVQYVYKYAKLISENRNVDLEVVELSALLHDIAMTDKSLDKSKHNEYGAEIAEQLLTEYGLDKDKIELVKKCILNHSSKRKEYRTTEEEKVLVNADAMAHFDCIDSLYSLATKVMGLNEEDSIQFVKDKLTKDYLEIDEDVRELVKEKYEQVMNQKGRVV